MKLSFTSVVVAAVAAVVNAAILTNPDYSGITAGVPFTITWSGASGPVTIILKNGPAGNLKTVAVLTDGETDGSFTWTPSKSLPDGTYAFEIKDSSGINYSPQFELSGGAASSATSATSSSATKTSDSSSDTKSSTSAKSSSTASSTTSSNTTITTSTSATTQGPTSARTTTSSTSSTSTARTTANLNNGHHFASPLAFVLVTVATLVFMN